MNPFKYPFKYFIKRYYSSNLKANELKRMLNMDKNLVWWESKKYPVKQHQKYYMNI